MSSAVLVHLGRVAAAGVLVLDRRQLARVVRVRVRSATEASSRHRIQRLGKIGGSLQNDLLWQTFWISRVPRDQFAQSAEPVINRGLVEGWNCSFSYCQLFLYRLMIDLNAVFGIIMRMTQLGTNCCSNSTKANQSSSQWGVCRGAGRGKNAKKTGVKKS